MDLGWIFWLLREEIEAMIGPIEDAAIAAGETFPLPTSFVGDLAAVINKHSQENASNTPDFILAQFLCGCLAAFNTAVQQRETWYERDPRF